MKKKERIDIRLEIEPRSPFMGWGNDHERKQIEVLESVKHEIKRHVDDVGSMVIMYETREYCEHCNMDWDVDEDGYPWCCTDAQDEWSGGVEVEDR